MTPPKDSIDTGLSDGMLRWFEDHAAQGLFTTDRDLVVRSWNRWLESATTLMADDVIGRPLFDVGSPQGAAER